MFDECRIDVGELEAWQRGDSASGMDKVIRDQQRYMRKMNRR